MIEMRAEVTVGAGQRLESGDVDRTAISCRKSEIELNLPHEQSIPSAGRILAPPSLDGVFATTEARGKIFFENLL
jgi:hypothetical protein